MSDYLGQKGYSAFLPQGRSTKKPAITQADPTEAELTRRDNWLTKQETACAIIKSRCGGNALNYLDTCHDGGPLPTRVHRYLQALESRFRPTGSAVLQRV